MTVFYPDYSSYQGQAVVPMGVAAVVAKATEGNYYQDADYSWYEHQAWALGVPFSGYHFLKADVDPATQAAYYNSFAGKTPCMLDVETEGSSKPTVDQVVAFIIALKRLGGRVWGVYFPQWYWSLVGGDLSLLEASGAVLVASSYRPYSDSNWPTAYGGAVPAVWQYTSGYNLNGTSVDYNAFRGTAEQLAAIINGDTMDPTTNLTFSPLIDGWYPDIVKDGGTWSGTQTANDVWTWTAARVGHIVHVVEGLQKAVADLTNTVSHLQMGVGATPQQNAAETLAELKAKL